MRSSVHDVDRRPDRLSVRYTHSSRLKAFYPLTNSVDSKCVQHTTSTYGDGFPQVCLHLATESEPRVIPRWVERPYVWPLCSLPFNWPIECYARLTTRHPMRTDDVACQRLLFFVTTQSQNVLHFLTYPCIWTISVECVCKDFLFRPLQLKKIYIYI